MTLKEAIYHCNNIVFFGGAGVSTESGIPDFRSEDGIYNMKYAYPPETILSHTFFKQHPSDFYKFYRDKLLHPKAMPNKAHLALAELERRGKLKAVVTQNIDGLHHKAGSKNVLELHGSCNRYYCLTCSKKYGIEALFESEDIPHCICGGIIRPDVVLFEESLDNDIIDRAIRAITESDTLIVGGTSLNVYPAAGMIQYYRGNMLVLINKSETSYDNHANLIIRTPIGEALDMVL